MLVVKEAKKNQHKNKNHFKFYHYHNLLETKINKYLIVEFVQFEILYTLDKNWHNFQLK